MEIPQSGNRWKRTTTGRPVRMVRGGTVNRTYRFYVMKHGSVDPDEVQHGRVSVLQHSQARHDPRNPRVPYSNEQHE